MNREPDALRRYLDGELERDALPPELRAEADRFERLFATLDRRAALPFSVKARVMDRIRRQPGGGWRRAWQWAIEARTLRLSPLGGALALAAGVALVLLARPFLPDAAEGSETVVARFVYIAPQASHVAVTGDFANWDPAGIPLERGSGGTWVAEVRLEPGLHHYVFVVDGSEWHPDPNAASQVDDGFGQRNSVLLIPPRRAS
jgi:hypothetical protein